MDIVERPWGRFIILEESACHKVKRLTINPGSTLSLQRHQRRNEHWVVISGVAYVMKDLYSFTLYPNQSTYINCGEIHQLSNPTANFLEVIEVQTGTYFGEDDIERL